MKHWLRILACGLLAAILTRAAVAQPQPISSVAISSIAVAGGSTYTGTAVNESSGAYTNALTITATATGGALPFVYSILVNGKIIAPTSPAVWTPPEPGVYFISATLTDGSATSVSSLPVRYFATGTTIVNPLPNTLVPNGSSVVIQAAATPAPSAPVAFVQKMEFYSDGALVGTDTTYPYSFIYKPDNTLTPPQTHSLTAISYDNTGAPIGTSTPVAITTVTPIAPGPTSTITSPANNANVIIDTIPIGVNASSASGFVSKVELYIDGQLYGIDTVFPYGFTWTPTVLGTYRLTAITYDDKSNAIASPTNVVNITASANGGGGGGGISKLDPSAIGISPNSAAPGDTVSVSITAKSSASTDFTGTADFSLTLTHLLTGATFTFTKTGVSPVGGLISAATTDPTTGQNVPGIGTFTFSEKIPISTTEAGNYRATVTMSNITNQISAVPQFAVATSALTVVGKPDLQITSLTYPAGTSYVGGDVIPMQLTYVNRERTNNVYNVPYVPGVGTIAPFVRIQVVLSTNPTFGDSDDFQLTLQDINASNVGSTDNNFNPAVIADGATHTFNWFQVLPGNFAGSYYVLAKIDQLKALDQNDPPELTVNGNNVWGGNQLNPSATLINIEPSNFQAVGLGSHAAGTTTSASGYSDNPTLSADGRFVAFVSDSTNLISGDTNGFRDVYLYDSQTSLVRRISVSQQGAEASGASSNPAFAADGRYVAFSSEATNLIFGDNNRFSDIFVVDVINGLMTRVSVAADGTEANNPSFRPAISRTGRFIVFESSATNLDRLNYAVTSGTNHIYVHDRDVSGSGTFDTAGNISTRLVDVGASAPGTAFANAASTQAAISADGALIAFSSRATNLVATATTTGRQNVYVRPRANVGTAISGLKLVSVATATALEGNGNSQTPSLSADGRYVAFGSVASNLVANDTNRVSDVFVYDNNAAVGAPIVRRMSINTAGGQGYDSSPSGFQLGSINPTISADGRFVAFASLAANLTTGDSVGQYQGSGATATATVNGFGSVTGLTVTTGGSLYSQSSAPIVTITDTTGTGATADAIVSASGVVTGFTVTNGGSGYSATPIVTIGSDANDGLDIFVHDRDAGETGTFDTGTITTQLVSVNTFGYQTGGLLGVPSTSASNIFPAISANGRYVALPSDSENVAGLAFGATNLKPYDGNGFRDIFLVDRRTTASSTPSSPPTVAITSPGTGNPVLVDTTVSVNAAATAATFGGTPVGVVSKIDFYVDGTSLGTATSFPFTVPWKPTATGVYRLSAIVTDSFGNTGGSPTVSISVIALPSIDISSPAAGTKINRGATVEVRAVALPASSSSTLTSVQFLLNGGGSLPAAAFRPGTLANDPGYYYTTWTPTQEGTYTLSAIANDSVGTQKTATAVTVSVIIPTVDPTPVVNKAPTVALTSVSNGTVVKVNGSMTLSANATDTDGTISSVQFFVNDVALGQPITTSSGGVFKTTFEPKAEGVYRITAVSRDNSGATTASTAATIFAVSVSDSVSTGLLGGSGGFFAAMSARGKTATFIGYDKAADKIYFFSGLPMGSTGTFSGTTPSGGASVAGTITDFAAFGAVDDGRAIFSGSASLTGAVAVGYYTGSLAARPASTLVGIVGGADDSITIYAADGDFKAVGKGNVAATGGFDFIGSGGVRFTGKADPATGFLSGTLGSAQLGTVAFNGATTAGIVFSDGFLRNLSTRGPVQSGEGVLIAGFVVDGTVPKRVIVRAIGPKLVDFAVTGVLADPQLSILNKDGIEVARNDDWGVPVGLAPASGSAIATASGPVGAFALNSGSKDAVVLTTLAPGAYTAKVSSGSGSGIALVEFYDVDNPEPFSAQKVINISTRGMVGAGQGQLIAGFSISGNSSKKVLIRGVGPTLAEFNVGGALADPYLQLVKMVPGSTSTIFVRENDNWETGNDAALVAEAASRVGGFALPPGSKDAVILLNLPPGNYSAMLTGVGGSSGVGLVEVYEVP